MGLASKMVWVGKGANTRVWGMRVKRPERESEGETKRQSKWIEGRQRAKGATS